MRKRGIALVLIICVLATTACGKTKDEGNGEVVLDQATRELRQNDYRGGVMRTFVLQNGVLTLMENMKANNVVIRESSPNSFWTAEEYQDFVSTFLDIAIINETQWFNEEETDWATVITQMSTIPSTFTTPVDGGYKFLNSVSVTRNEKDDYAIRGVNGYLATDSISHFAMVYSGSTNYRILYDCDKDWCKAYTQMLVTNELPEITSQLYEYRRVDDNTFAIQTSRERLYVIFEPADVDTDIRNRVIKEFYYSKLTAEGQRTTFPAYEPLIEYDDYGTAYVENIKKNTLMAKYPALNEKGDFSIRYGINDSIFLVPTEEMLPSWTYEDKSLQQALTYKDGVLIVTTYNKLSGAYERFIYTLEGVENDKEIVEELEQMVEISRLVGIQENQAEKPIGEETSKTNDNTDEGITETDMQMLEMVMQVLATGMGDVTINKDGTTSGNDTTALLESVMKMASGSDKLTKEDKENIMDEVNKVMKEQKKMEEQAGIEEEKEK